MYFFLLFFHGISGIITSHSDLAVVIAIEQGLRWKMKPESDFSFWKNPFSFFHFILKVIFSFLC